MLAVLYKDYVNLKVQLCSCAVLVIFTGAKVRLARELYKREGIKAEIFCNLWAGKSRFAI